MQVRIEKGKKFMICEFFVFVGCVAIVNDSISQLMGKIDYINLWENFKIPLKF